VCFNMVAIP